MRKAPEYSSKYEHPLSAPPPRATAETDFDLDTDVEPSAPVAYVAPDLNQYNTGYPVAEIDQYAGAQSAPNAEHQGVNYAEQADQYDLDDASTQSEPYKTGYPSPQKEEYNYTAPRDPAAWDEPEPDLEHRPRCTGCGTMLEVGSQFCGECGHRLEARIPGCHLCGSPLEPSAKFCGECGSRCGGSRPAPPMPERILDAHRIPDRQSDEYEQYVASQKPTQRSWVVKLLKILET